VVSAGDLTVNERIGAWASASPGSGQSAVINEANQQVQSQKTTNQYLSRIEQVLKQNPLSVRGVIEEAIKGSFR
jgi:hypothetical protein